MDELIAENEAVNMKALIKSGPPVHPAFNKAMLKGDRPVVLVALNKAGSVEEQIMPAKKIMPK